MARVSTARASRSGASDRIHAALIDTLEVRLQEEFRTHTRQIREHRTLWVKLRCGTQWGHGEAFAYSIEEPLKELESLRLIGESIWDMHTILESIRHPSARAAVDLALHDLIAKRCDLPLGRWLLAPRREVPSALSIGIQPDTEVLAKVARWRQCGIRTFKLKVGRETEAGLLRAVRRELGNDAAFWLDANQGWDAELTARLGPALAECGVLFLEQPLPVGQISEYATLRKHLRIPIYLDEEVCAVADVVRAAAAGGVDGINVKLSKCGGIRDSLRQIEVARALGLKILIGCFFEGPISISSAAHLQGFADHLDLDAGLYSQTTPAFRGANYEGAYLRPTVESGHGARLCERRSPTPLDD